MKTLVSHATLALTLFALAGCVDNSEIALQEKLAHYNNLTSLEIQKYQNKAEYLLKQVCGALVNTKKAICEQARIKIVPTAAKLDFASINTDSGLIKIETISVLEFEDELLKSGIAHEIGHFINLHERGLIWIILGGRLKEEILADKFAASITNKDTAMRFFYKA